MGVSGVGLHKVHTRGGSHDVPRNASLIFWNRDVAASSPGCLSGWYLCATQRVA